MARTPAVLLSLSLLSAACSAPTPATVSARILGPDRLAVNELLRIDLEWRVGESFRPPADNGRIFVHVFDESGGTILSDYHVPDPPLQDWSAGDELTYSHWIELPLLAPGDRLEVAVGLQGDEGGIPISVPSEGVVDELRHRLEVTDGELPGAPRYLEGWHDVTRDWNSGRTARWTGSRATVSLAPPSGGGTLHLSAFAAGALLEEVQTVELLLDGRELLSFEAPEYRQIHRHIPIAPWVVDSERMLLEIRVDPVHRPGAAGDAPRSYGIQVARLYLESRERPTPAE